MQYPVIIDHAITTPIALTFTPNKLLSGKGNEIAKE